MPRTPIEAVSQDAPRSAAVGSAIRVLSLAGATLTTGLVAGVFYAYAVSVNLGLRVQPDASYIATMQAINQKIQNPLFFLSFFGAVLFLLVALAVHLPRPRFGRFWLIALASALYVGGGFLLTVVVNVPLNEELARVVGDTPAGELARGPLTKAPGTSGTACGRCSRFWRLSPSWAPACCARTVASRWLHRRGHHL
jgi:uncharacterized membrane protein